MSKELWFAEMERRLITKLDQGKTWDQAYEEASNEAYDGVRENLADIADRERKRAKGE